MFPHRKAPLGAAVLSACASLAGCSSDDAATNAAAPSSPASASEPTVTRVAMRDGVELHTEVLLPAGVGPDGVPALLLRTPYDLPTAPPGGLAPDDDDDGGGGGGDDGEDAAALRAAWQPVLERGYAVVVQNLRGTQGSGGEHRLFATEREDGVDALAWIREQPWSDGRVGALGDSAAAFSLHLLAAERPEGLGATFSQVSCGDLWGSAILPEGGNLKLEAFLPFMLQQALESSDSHRASLGLDATTIEAREGEVLGALGALFGDDPGARRDALSVQPFIDYPGVSTLLPRWREVLDEANAGDRQAYFDTRGRSAVPGMHVTLWQDVFAECAIGDFQALADGPAEQRLLVLDGSHYDIDDPERWPYLPMLDWFDRHLKGAAGDDRAAVQYAVQSAGSADAPSSELLDADAWPPADAQERAFQLDVDGALSDAAPIAPASFPIASDPETPSSTVGGRHLALPAGVAEQPAPQDDTTAQAFATAPFDAAATIAGEVRLEALLTADVPDVDLHARLVELTADGRRVLIVAGLQRARYRNGPLVPAPLAPGTAVPMAVALGNVAHRVAAGSRLQLELTGSDFPGWSANPQTGDVPFTATTRRAGTLVVSTDPATPARLIVPFLP